MQIPISVRLKLLRQALLARLDINENKPVKVSKGPHGAVVSVADRDIHVPSALRWKLYRKGWEARLAWLARDYGVGNRFVLSSNDIVVDIGANAGEFAHICAQAGATAFCFEPDPDVFACLKANTKDLANIFHFDKVIWKDIGEIEFGLAPERADSSVFAETQTKILRQTTTLTQFFDQQSFTHIDLIKCDAEGAEPEVLMGARPILRRVREIAFDTGPERRGVRTHEACTQILEAEGFKVENAAVDGRLMTFGTNLAFQPSRYQKTS